MTTGAMVNVLGEFTSQHWRGDDGTLCTGSELSARQVDRGLFNFQGAVEFFRSSKVGTVLKTGVSAWERIK